MYCYIVDYKKGKRKRTSYTDISQNVEWRVINLFRQN
jgi:hypothetical protein